MATFNGVPRTEALFTSIAYGDAAGLPVETMHADDIAARYGYINSLVPPTDNPFFKGEYPIGTTSDDTQLTLAVAEGLTQSKTYDLDEQARQHLAAFYAAPRITVEGKQKVQGWGGSTTRSMERLQSGVEPSNSGEIGGAGNGVVMKLAPLSLRNTMIGADEFDRAYSYDSLTSMTHDSDVARLATRLHGEVLHGLINGAPLASTVEYMVATLPDTDTYADDCDHIRRAVNEPATSLQQLIERYATGKTGFEYGFYVPETLAIAYDIYASHSDDPIRAIFTAVNLGGDSDSIASIVASMCAVDGDGMELPDDYVRLKDLEIIKEKAAAFERATGVMS